jgi:hypothetical protein
MNNELPDRGGFFPDQGKMEKSALMISLVKVSA